MSTTTNLEAAMAELNRQVAAYIVFGQKLPEDALLKQGKKLAFAVGTRLSAMKPARGSIKAGSLARLRAGGGILIRPSVRAAVSQRFSERQDVRTRRTLIGGKKASATLLRGGKRLNIQALRVKAELALRERGIGYLGFAGRLGGLSNLTPGKREELLGRYNQKLAEAGLQIVQNGASLEVKWLGRESGVEVGEALQKPRMQAALQAALEDVSLDIMEYVERKHRELTALK